MVSWFSSLLFHYQICYFIQCTNSIQLFCHLLDNSVSLLPFLNMFLIHLNRLLVLLNCYTFALRESSSISGTIFVVCVLLFVSDYIWVSTVTPLFFTKFCPCVSPHVAHQLGIFERSRRVPLPRSKIWNKLWSISSTGRLEELKLSPPDHLAAWFIPNVRKSTDTCCSGRHNNYTVRLPGNLLASNACILH